MSRDKTSKQGDGSKHAPIESSSPIGHEEIEEAAISETLGADRPTEPRPSPPGRDRKPLKPDQPQNPKRTRNSRPGS